jgi:hypothetical protein
MKATSSSLVRTSVLVGVTAAVAFYAGNSIGPGTAHEPRQPQNQPKKADPDTYLLQSPGASVDRGNEDFGLGDGHISKLKPYPPGRAGSRTPFDLWLYAGRGANSWKSPTLDMPWDDWLDMCQKQKPKLMEDCKAYMEGRFDFHGRAIAGVKMSGGKPIMLGPVARLPRGFASYEELAKLSPA